MKHWLGVVTARGPLCAAVGVVMVAAMLLQGAADPPWVSGILWPVPDVVDPGGPGVPPSDAIVLFDGKDLSAWKGVEKWTVENGYAVCRGGAQTRQPFGDCQLHVEWCEPPDVQGSGQARGNSGVYLMGMYEVQILDSYKNDTYVDGQAGAVYKQHPPLVNACRKPGEWQVYDIIFRGPRFDRQELVRPATITVLQNGVLVQDHFELLGRSGYRKPPAYSPHESKLPLQIQYHGSPVRFRNIWIRELGDAGEHLLAPLRARLAGAASRPA
jgi:hypothetical protein